jgi:sugar lactone lactonase YvrE
MHIGRSVLWLVVLAGLAAIVLAPSAKVIVGQATQDKGGADVTGPYDYVPNWPDDSFFEKGWTWGSTPAIFAQSPDRVFVYMRGELPALKIQDAGGRSIELARASHLNLIAAVMEQSRQKPRMQHMVMVFDKAGKLVDSWEQHNKEFVNAHSVSISPYDSEKHVWLVDHNGHQVLKFTNDGKKLAMRLGEKGVPGTDKVHFDQPSGIAFMPNGDFFITDGYGNTRVTRFSKDGKYLYEFGKPGKGPNPGPSEFNTVHSMVIDARHRLYVSDRNNSRVQVFDEQGKFIEMWKDIPLPYFLYMDKDQNIWIGDGTVHKILKYDLNGKLQYHWGTFGRRPGELWGPHAISVDSEGSLYIANAQGNNVAKYRPKRGADPAKLIAAPFLLPTTSGGQ